MDFRSRRKCTCINLHSKTAIKTGNHLAVPFFKVLINHSHNHQQNSLTVYIKTNHAWNINPPPPPQMFNNQ